MIQRRNQPPSTTPSGLSFIGPLIGLMELHKADECEFAQSGRQASRRPLRTLGLWLDSGGIALITCRSAADGSQWPLVTSGYSRTRPSAAEYGFRGSMAGDRVEPPFVKTDH